jgi:formate C-acetyltransferase
MSITIGEDEIIVGNRSLKPRACPVFPEMSIDWVVEEMDRFSVRPVDTFVTPEKVKEEVKKLAPYWQGKSVYDCVVEQFSPFHWHLLEANVLWVHNNMYNGIGHILPDFPKIIRMGLKGIREEILACLERSASEDSKNESKIDFYRAGMLVIDAAVTFARRHAKEARRLASLTTDDKRKAELVKIAEICEWVPENPARTFREACQSYWIAHCICFIESDGMSISPGRFDQYMYPYYEVDIKEGRLTKEGATELLECLWIKFAERHQRAFVSLYRGNRTPCLTATECVCASASLVAA